MSVDWKSTEIVAAELAPREAWAAGDRVGFAAACFDRPPISLSGVVRVIEGDNVVIDLDGGETVVLALSALTTSTPAHPHHCTSE